MTITTTIDHLLGDLADTHEIVLRRAEDGNPLLSAWRDAAEDARGAYAAWCVLPSAATYAVYVAMRDQADAAADTLAAGCRAVVGPCGPHAARPLAA